MSTDIQNATPEPTSDYRSGFNNAVNRKNKIYFRNYPLCFIIAVLCLFVFYGYFCHGTQCAIKDAHKTIVSAQCNQIKSIDSLHCVLINAVKANGENVRSHIGWLP